MGHSYYGVLYASVQKNEVMSFAGKWMELEKSYWIRLFRSCKTNITCYFLLEVSRSKCSYVNTDAGVTTDTRKVKRDS